MSNQLGDANTIYLILFFIIANTLLCLFFINRYLEQKKINKQLRNAQLKSPTVKIRRYLNEQFNNTRAKKTTCIPNIDITHDIIKLRTAYLRIESNALNNAVNSSEYWSYLTTNLHKLLRILTPMEHAAKPKFDLLCQVKNIQHRFNVITNACKDPKAIKHRERISKNIDTVYEKIQSSNLNNSQLKTYHKKLEQLVSQYEDHTTRDAHIKNKSRSDHHNAKARALKKMAEHCEDNSATVNYVKSIDLSDDHNKEIIDRLSKYEKENDRLTRYVNQLKHKLEEFHISQAGGISSKNGGDNAHLESDLNEEIITANETEIARLRDVVKSQRNAILDLEEMANSSEHVDAAELDQFCLEVEQLKRSALDSEMCVKVLEDELESLRTSLKTPPNEDSSINAQEVERLNQELSELKDELMHTEELNDQYESLLNFVFDALTATSVEDVSLLLHESLASLSFSPLILIKSADRTIEMFEDGSLSVRDKTIISNLQLNEINPQKGGQLVFRMDNITGLVKPTDNQDLPEDIHQHVIQILKLANRVIRQILQAQRNRTEVQKIDGSVSDIKEASYEVDELIESFVKNTKFIITDSFTQLKNTARSKGLNASQIAAFHAIEKDALGQIQIEDTVRPKIRKKFLSVINKIEGH